MKNKSFNALMEREERREEGKQREGEKERGREEGKNNNGWCICTRERDRER